MTLREFLKLYNFREIVRTKENTQIIRIYTDWPSEWFEFGVNDWGHEKERDKRVESFINKEVLDQEVTSINYDRENDVFCVHVEKTNTPQG